MSRVRIGMPGIKHDNRGRFSFCSELLIHLVHNQATRADTRHQVWPLRLNLSNSMDVMRRHFWHRCERSLVPIEAPRLQSVDRLLRPHELGELGKNQNISSDPWYHEYRRRRSAWLNRYKRLPLGRPVSVSENLRQFRNGRCLKQRGERQLLSEDGLKLKKELGGFQRVPSEIKKVVVNADLLHLQHLLPKGCELHFHTVSWLLIAASS